MLDQLGLVQISELKMPLITWVISIDTIKVTKSNSGSGYLILASPIVPDPISELKMRLVTRLI
jgi:hypothetical protein